MGAEERACSCEASSLSERRATRSATRAARGSEALQKGRPRTSGWLQARPAASGGPTGAGGSGPSHARRYTALKPGAPQLSPGAPPGHASAQEPAGASCAPAATASPQ